MNRSTSMASCGHRRMAGKLTVTACVFAAGCVSAPLSTPYASAADEPGASTTLTPFVHGEIGTSLDARVPTPESVIGHVLGDGAVRYDEAVRYLTTLAKVSPYVVMTPYAKTHEGRTLYFLTITSEANHAHLDQIKADNAKLADPRKMRDAAEAERIQRTLPGIAWLAYSIHGDEMSGSDAAVRLAYQLAAGTDPSTRRLRDELVIHIDPMMNPDGRERYLSQIQTLTGKVSNPDYQAMQHSGLWSAGRGNHYLFDLNRDWLMQVHPETRGRAARILEWNPHLVVDAHEMGSLETYLFDPPREPINGNLSPRTLSWRRRFSGDQAKAFDSHAWSYYTREWYEEWYPGYTNSWASLLGAVGVLYEQARVNAASIRQPAGNLLTYRDAVYHHFVSSLANLESLRVNRSAILRDYFDDRAWAVDPDRSGTEALVVPPPADRSRFVRFLALLSEQGIEFGLAQSAFVAENTVDVWGDRNDTQPMPIGSLVVRAAQPHHRFVHALLDFDPRMTDAFLLDERKDLENHRGTRLYDNTAWNLCMAYGLDAVWAQRISDVTTAPPRDAHPARADRRPGYAYVIDGADSDIYRAVVRLQNADVKVRVATEPFSVNGHAYERGSVLVRVNENTDDLARLVHRVVADLGVAVRSTDTALSDDGPDLGGERFRLLELPRIAIASQFPIATTSFGATWYLLDARIGLRASPINIQALGRMDLRRYNVIVLPDAWSGGALAAILNQATTTRLKNWIKAGGTLIAVGSSAAFVAGKDRGLSSVRMRRDVLDELSVYQEALKRERSARDVKVDPEAVWGAREADAGDKDDDAKSPGKDGDTTSNGPASGDKKTLERKDAFQRMFSPSGVMVKAILDTDNWLCAGASPSASHERNLPVMVSGSNVFMSKYPVQTPVRLAGEDDLRLSGLLWPEARQRLANSAYATVERVGHGQIILFAADPFFRGYFEATGRLFLNAMLYGPGLGASQSVPW